MQSSFLYRCGKSSSLERKAFLMAVHSAKGRVVVGGFLRAKLAASPLAARTFATLASPLVAGADLFLPGGASTLGSLCSPASLEILWGGVFGGDISSPSWESFTLDLGLAFDFALPAAFVLSLLLDLHAAFVLLLPLGLDAAAFAFAFAFALGVALGRAPLPFGLPGFLPLPLPLVGFLSSPSGSWGALVANCSILELGSCREGGKYKEHCKGETERRWNWNLCWKILEVKVCI